MSRIERTPKNRAEKNTRHHTDARHFLGEDTKKENVSVSVTGRTCVALTPLPDMSFYF